MTSARLRSALSVVLLLAVVAPIARAAEPVRDDFPAERLRLAPNRSGIVDTIWGAVPEAWAWDVGLWVGYANDPLVLYRASDRERMGSLVSDRVGGALVGSLGLFGWGEISLELPLVLWQDRPTTIPGGTAPGMTLPTLSGVGLSDLRVYPKIQLFGQEDDGFDLSVIVGFTVPTGGGAAYRGDRGFTLYPEIAGSRKWEHLRLAANLGAQLRSEPITFLNQIVESELSLRAGAAWRTGEGGKGPWEFGADWASAVSANRPFAHFNQNASELRGQVGYDVWGPLQAFLGAGVGVASGYGTPDWRVYGGLRFGPWEEQPVQDRDRDGVADGDEARAECLDQPEDKDAFEDADGCPDPDNDKDGVLDVAEARPDCVNVPEDKDGFEDADGCQDPDNDQDGVLDTAEARPDCVNVVEDKDGFDDADGCVDPDNDQDGVLDGDDRCPREAGPVAERGCPPDPNRDTDKDGVIDTKEARPECIDQPEDKDSFEDADGCPDPDNDKDGVLDVAEARPDCVNVPEDKDGFEDADGCVDPDNDQDGVLDAADSCRDLAGVADNLGCPDKDRDADGVVDRSDNCPDLAGIAANQGCPAEKKQLVVVKKDRIEILDSVYFALDKDVILAKSFPLLDNVVDVLQGHPEITKIRIEGHTDSQGKLAHNMDLSDRRAKAVKKYLVGKGVDGARLDSEGYGPNKPIADNKTVDGRAKNRRVEFNVLESGGVKIEKQDSGPTKDTLETQPKAK